MEFNSTLIVRFLEWGMLSFMSNHHMQLLDGPLFGPGNIKELGREMLDKHGVVVLRLFDAKSDVQRRLFRVWWWDVNYYRFKVVKPDAPDAQLVIRQERLVDGEDEFGVLYDTRLFGTFDSIRARVLYAISTWRAAGRPSVFNSDA